MLLVVVVSISTLPQRILLGCVLPITLVLVDEVDPVRLHEAIKDLDECL
jgi:hypothetical protein